MDTLKIISSFGGNGTSTGNLLYFYHPDHLGSSSYITNADGAVTQHIEYVPYGEVFLEEKNSTWRTPYKFNAKELDEETGLYYYGARYYDPKTSVWISVDPLAEDYPNFSSYNYCLGNPVTLLDPDGRGPQDMHAFCYIMATRNDKSRCFIRNSISYNTKSRKGCITQIYFTL